MFHITIKDFPKKKGKRKPKENKEVINIQTEEIVEKTITNKKTGKKSIKQEATI